MTYILFAQPLMIWLCVKHLSLPLCAFFLVSRVGMRLLSLQWRDGCILIYATRTQNNSTILNCMKQLNIIANNKKRSLVRRAYNKMPLLHYRDGIMWLKL